MNITALAPIAIVAVVVIGVIYMLYRRAWHIPRPDEALIVVGKSRKEGGPKTADEIEGDASKAIQDGVIEGLDFRIETGAAWVNPITQRVYKLPLDSRQTEFNVACHDRDKIAVEVTGAVLFKVGDNYPAMAAAARRFLAQEDDGLNVMIRELVTGQVRALVGTMTISEMITERQKLIEEVRDTTKDDMSRLGLSIDSLTIQGLDDPNDYISNLGKPQSELVAQAAAIASAQARQQTEQAAQAAELEIARSTRDTQIEIARYQAEQDTEKQKAEQAGPLAKAQAERDVVTSRTEVARLEAAMTEQQLDASVRKRADAERYAAEQAAEANKAVAIADAEGEASRLQQIGQAEAEATRLRGEAEAKTIEALGLAEAKGIKEKAEALATNGQQVIDQKIADQLPEIAKAFAEPLGNIDNLMVLDGADGLSKSVVGAVMNAGDAIDGIRGLTGKRNVSTATDPKSDGPAGLPGADQTEVASVVSGAQGRTVRSPRTRVQPVSVPSSEELAASRDAASESTGADGDSGDREPWSNVSVESVAGELSGLLQGQSVREIGASMLTAVRDNPQLRSELAELASDAGQTEQLLSMLSLDPRAEQLVRMALDELAEERQG